MLEAIVDLNQGMKKAGYGNRTRLSGLGSPRTTDVLTLQKKTINSAKTFIRIAFWVSSVNRRPFLLLFHKNERVLLYNLTTL